MGNDGVVLDIVSACVVGGVSIYGGSGRVPGAVFGAVLITVLSNSMNLIGVSYYLSLFIKGAVIIAFIATERGKGNAIEYFPEPPTHGSHFTRVSRCRSFAALHPTTYRS